MIKNVKNKRNEMCNIEIIKDGNKNNIKKDNAITLIALIITIIVLLILARSKYCSTNGGKWIIK